MSNGDKFRVWVGVPEEKERFQNKSYIIPIIADERQDTSEMFLCMEDSQHGFTSFVLLENIRCFLEALNRKVDTEYTFVNFNDLGEDHSRLIFRCNMCHRASEGWYDSQVRDNWDDVMICEKCFPDLREIIQETLDEYDVGEEEIAEIL